MREGISLSGVHAAAKVCDVIFLAGCSFGEDHRLTEFGYSNFGEKSKFSLRGGYLHVVLLYRVVAGSTGEREGQ